MLIGYALYQDTRRKYKEMDNVLDPIFNLNNRIINILQWISKRSFLFIITFFSNIFCLCC